MRKSEGVTFEQWLKRVDAILMAEIGMSHSCLADGPSRQSFDDDETPKEYITGGLTDYNEELAEFFE